MGYEFELKYSATEEILTAVRQQLGAQWQTISMETTYYDDPMHRLSALHYTLRRRLENGVSICTLKTPMPDGGRGEWEIPCASVEDAIPELCRLGCPRQLLLLTAEGIAPSCGARFTRQAGTLQLEGAVVEIALDQGILFGGGKEIPLCELEVELKSGSKEEAIRFSRELADKYSLIPQAKSKVSRATALTEG